MTTNPVTDARLTLSLTQEELARQAYTTRNLVIKVEHGAYRKIPPAIMEFFAQRSDSLEHPFDSQQFQQQYEEFQRSRRETAGRFLGNFPLNNYLGLLSESEDNPEVPLLHPLEYWRNLNNCSLNSLSNKLCVQQAVLYKFEKQPNLVNSLPKPLESALLDAGYTRATLGLFELAYIEYKRALRNRQEQTSGA